MPDTLTLCQVEVDRPTAPDLVLDLLRDRGLTVGRLDSRYTGRDFDAAGETPDTAHVVGTNRVDLSAVLDPRTGNFVLTSAEDNLVKGASGQAVQNMNVMCGFPETLGLRTPGLYP